MLGRNVILLENGFNVPDYVTSRKLQVVVWQTLVPHLTPPASYTVFTATYVRVLIFFGTLYYINYVAYYMHLVKIF